MTSPVQFLYHLYSIYHLYNRFLFYQVWREYDTDHSGYIEADELKVRGLWPLTPLDKQVNADFLCVQR